MSAKKKTPSKTAKTHAMQETISSVKDGVFGGKAVAIDRDGISELGLSIVFIVYGVKVRVPALNQVYNPNVSISICNTESRDTLKSTVFCFIHPTRIRTTSQTRPF